MLKNLSSDGNTISLTFDLDGTIVDTAPDLIRVLNEVSAPDGIAAIPVEDIRHLTGKGSMALIKTAYETAGVNLPEAHAKNLQIQFLDVYMQSISQLSLPLCGRSGSLGTIKTRWRKALCVHKQTRRYGAGFTRTAKP